MADNIILLGAFALGGFVGFLLGLTLRVPQNVNLKIVIAVIGAALGGAPILFMQGLTHQKWMYPVGLVVGFFWVRLISARNIVMKKPKKSERVAWYIGWLDTLAVLSITAIVVACAAFVETNSDSDKDSEVVQVSRKEMPCRWAWVYLGRYSHQKGKYELPAAFRYSEDRGPAAPIPKSGDQIILTAERSLIITNYSSAEPGHKCDAILDPPWGYRPETEGEFKAGTLPVKSLVLVNQVVLMPSPTAEPAYVWTLVGPEG